MRIAALAVLLLLTGCAQQPHQVTVFAAASLTDAFEQLAAEFEVHNPDVEVVLSFGGSSGLAAQIEQGAPADVFASASTQYLDGEIFATNRLAIAGSVTSLQQFADPDLAIALCAIEVPCGSAAAAFLDAEGIIPSVDTYEQDVRSVLTKVELGEADAGIVYVSDLRGSGVDGVELDSDPIEYPIATLSEKDSAAAFTAFVRSERGRSILAEWGFGAP